MGACICALDKTAGTTAGNVYDAGAGAGAWRLRADTVGAGAGACMLMAGMGA